MKATQNSAPNSPRVSFCPACGAQVQQPDARFCNHCGTPLAPAKKLSVEEKKPPVSKPKKRAGKRTGSGKKALLAVLIVLAVLVAAAIVLITMCLGVLGIQVHTIVAVIGAAGAAIALALKDSLANIAGGVMIILTKPFSKDDLIDIGDVSGKVHHIDLFLTTLKTYDNKTITIPNGIVNTSVLVNHSQEEKRRVDCTFGIGYDDDIEHAKEIMRKVCDDNPLILTDPQPLIGVANHGESSVDMDLKAWCLTEHYWDVKYYLEEHIKVAFDENGIQIPFPQMDVHIHHE